MDPTCFQLLVLFSFLSWLTKEVAMRIHVVLCSTLCVLLLVACPADAPQDAKMRGMDDGPDEHLVYTQADVEWQEGPKSLEEGSEMAVLEGNPGADGYFNMWLKLPDGYHIAPHTHPNVERVTVMSGTFLLGTGEEGLREETDRLGVGSYASMPPGMPHYAYAEGETVVQLATVGPWEIEYVKEEDDPRMREAAEAETGEE